MKRTILPMFVLACATVALAQTPPPSQPPPAQGAKPGSVTVSGCLAEGTPAGHFMLNNAMMIPGAMKKEGAPPMATGDKSMTASYMLMGGENLKAHVGHKVEVTGTFGMAPKMDEKSATAKPMARELNVQSVKMISATCP